MTTATHRPLIPGVFLNCSSFNAHFPPFVGRLIYPNIYAGSGFLWSFFKHDILGGRRRIVTFTTFIRVRLLKWNWIRLGDKRPFPFICGPIEREERKAAARSSVSQGREREREGGRGFISPEHGSPINQGRFLSPAASAALGLRASRHPRGGRESVSRSAKRIGPSPSPPPPPSSHFFFSSPFLGPHLADLAAAATAVALSSFLQCLASVSGERDSERRPKGSAKARKGLGEIQNLKG